MRLKQKVSIITGAGSGIGASIAKTFATEGSKVVITDVNEESARRLSENLNGKGLNTIYFKHDVSSENDWKEIVPSIVRHYGKIDVLVNNAGIGNRDKIVETDLQQWQKVQSVNLQGVFLGIKYVAPKIKEAHGGSIINISSIYGIIGEGKGGAYHASKAGVRGLTKTVAIELANDKIRVNTIHPGVIETPMILDKLSNDRIRDRLEQLTPWPEFGTPDDIAKGALFLASEDSKFVTGTELIIDGGYTAL